MTLLFFYLLFNHFLLTFYYFFTHDLDIVYCKYLLYRQTSGIRFRRFYDFITDTMINESKRLAIEQEAANNFEALIDIQSDITELSKTNGIQTIKTYTCALIHSQLFEVPLLRAKHHLYSLDEFSKLPKSNNSFVSFHDEGITIYLLYIYYIFTIYLLIFYYVFTLL